MSSRWKKLGIVGGVAWPSTVEIYSTICSLAQQQGRPLVGPAPMPEMVIESLDAAQSFARRGVFGDEASWLAFDAYFNAALRRLESAGAELALIASNTPHNRFHAITRGLRMPVLNIFETVTAACVSAGIREVLVLGTAPTLASAAFSKALAAAGVRGHVPQDPADRAALFELILALQAGRGQEGAALMAAMARRAFEQLGVPEGPERAVSLSCTELPLAFPALRHLPLFEDQGLRWVNTSIVHAHAAFAALNRE